MVRIGNELRGIVHSEHSVNRYISRFRDRPEGPRRVMPCGACRAMGKEAIRPWKGNNRMALHRQWAGCARQEVGTALTLRTFGQKMA
jgi:hypothetical protein